MTSQPRHTEPLPLGGDGVPYSKGLMARALTAVGVPAMRAHELARRVEEDLRARGETVADLDRIEELADDDDAAMARLRRYFALRELDLPVIVLLGGATGTGKSTVATELAYRLGITRVTSTDFIRQTMRAFFSRDFMPSIHYSSFEAGEALREPEEAGDPAIVGFLDQTRNVLVGVHASLDRALEEGWSMVLEGVHLVPGLVEPPPEAEQARRRCAASSRSRTPPSTRRTSTSATPPRTAFARSRGTSTASPRSGGSRTSSSRARDAKASP